MVLKSFALLVGLITVDGKRKVDRFSGHSSNCDASLRRDVPRDSCKYRDFSGDGGDYLKQLFTEMQYAKFGLAGEKLQFQGIDGGLAVNTFQNVANMVNPFLGLGVSLIIGIFTPVDHKLELIRTILGHVNEMIDLKLDEERVRDNQEWLSSIAEDLRWAESESDWGNAISKFNNVKMFSQLCIDDVLSTDCENFQLTNGGKKLAQEMYYITMAASVWTEMKRLGSTSRAHRMAEVVWKGMEILNDHWARFKVWRMDSERFQAASDPYEGNDAGYYCYLPGEDLVTSRYIVAESCYGESYHGKPPTNFIDTTVYAPGYQPLRFCVKGWEANWENLQTQCRREYMARITADMEYIGRIVDEMETLGNKLEFEYTQFGR